MQEINAGLNMSVINTFNIYTQNKTNFDNILEQKDFEKVLKETEKFLNKKPLNFKEECEIAYIVVAKMLNLIEQKGDEKRKKYVKILETFIKNNFKTTTTESLLLGSWESGIKHLYNENINLFIDIVKAMQNRTNELENYKSTDSKVIKERIYNFLKSLEVNIDIPKKLIQR